LHTKNLRFWIPRRVSEFWSRLWQMAADPTEHLGSRSYQPKPSKVLLLKMLMVVIFGQRMALHDAEKGASDRGERGGGAPARSQGQDELAEHLRDRFASLCGLRLRLMYERVIHS
jgi:hypothetical protein